MKEENYIKFRNYVLEFIEYLNSNKLKVIIIHDDNNSKYPEISFKIKGINWIFGIWAVGNWSDFYRCNEDDKISFFGIHNWRLDKFRPSYSDFKYVFHIKNNHYKYFWEKCKDDLIYIKKHPIKSYLYNKTSKYSIEEFLKDWWFYKISYPLKMKIKYEISSLILWWILKGLSIFDPRISKSIKFKDKNCIPIYTFGFLTKINISENSLYKVWYLYSKIPGILRVKCKNNLFDSYFNVSDQDENLTEKEIRSRLYRGIYFK